MDDLDEMLGDLLAEGPPAKKTPQKKGPSNRISKMPDYQALAAAAAENEESDISDADPDEIAKQLGGLDDMDDALSSLRKTPNKKPSGPGKASTTPLKQGSSEAPKSTIKRVAKPSQVEDDYGDDILAGLLSDEDEPKPPKSSLKKPLAKKQESVEEDKLTGVNSNRLEVDRPPTRSGTAEAKKVSRPPKKDDDIMFDDDDVLGGMGLDSPRRVAPVTRSISDDPRPGGARSAMDDLLGSGTSHKSDTTGRKETTLEKITGKPTHKDDDEEDFQFGSYMPSAVATSSRPSSKRSVRFEDDDLLGEKPSSAGKKRPNMVESMVEKDTRDWLDIATGSPGPVKRSALKDDTRPSSEGSVRNKSGQAGENEDWLFLSRIGSPVTTPRSPAPDTTLKEPDFQAQKQEKSSKASANKFDESDDELPFPKAAKSLPLPNQDVRKKTEDTSGDWLGMKEKETDKADDWLGLKDPSSNKPDDWLGFQNDEEIGENFSAGLKTDTEALFRKNSPKGLRDSDDIFTTPKREMSASLPLEPRSRRDRGWSGHRSSSTSPLRLQPPTASTAGPGDTTSPAATPQHFSHGSGDMLPPPGPASTQSATASRGASSPAVRQDNLSASRGATSPAVRGATPPAVRQDNLFSDTPDLFSDTVDLTQGATGGVSASQQQQQQPQWRDIEAILRQQRERLPQDHHAEELELQQQFQLAQHQQMAALDNRPTISLDPPASPFTQSLTQPLSQPSSQPSLLRTGYSMAPSGGFMAGSMEYQTKIQALEQEKAHLQTMMMTTQHHHQEEIRVVEDSYKKRIQLQEEAWLSREHRLREENRLVSSESLERLKRLEEEKAQMMNGQIRQFNEWDVEKHVEISRLKELHRSALDELQREHQAALERVRACKNHELEAAVSASDHARRLQAVISRVEDHASSLDNLQDKVEGQQMTHLGEREVAARARDERLKGMQERLERQQHENEQERARLQGLITKLEVQLTEQSRQMEEEKWRVRQEEGRVKSLKTNLEQERKLMMEQVERDKQNVATAKTQLLEEQKTVLGQMAEERRSLAEDRAQFSITHRLKMDEEMKSSVSVKRNEAELEHSIRLINDEKSRISMETRELQADREKLKAERDKINQQANLQQIEKEKLEQLAMQVNQKSKEIQEMCRAAARAREEGQTALAMAHKKDGELTAKIDSISAQVEHLRRKEKQIAEERLALAREKHQQDSSPSLCQSCRTPIRDTSGQPGVRLGPAGRQLYSALGPDIQGQVNTEVMGNISASIELDKQVRMWMKTSKQDKMFLSEESVFLEALKTSPYSGQPNFNASS